MNNLHFDVRYYDDQHRQALQACTFPHSLDDLVRKGLDVSRDEFLTYMLFREQRMHVPEWQTYAELSRRLPDRDRLITDNFDLSEGTVRSRFTGANALDKTMVEAGGVGSGLVLANALFGLHEADWEKVPVSGTKSMDFEIASDGSRYIQVECKGAVVTDTTNLAPISQHKQSVEKKKTSVRAAGSQNVLLGVIGAFPTPKNMNAMLNLLDPNPVELEMPASKYKVLARLSYFGRLARAISDSRFVGAVRSRLQALTVAGDLRPFDGLPIEKNSGESYDFTVEGFAGHAVIPQFDAVGRLYVIRNQLLFDGLRLDCLNFVAKQDFAGIARYEARREKETVSFDGHVPRDAIRALDLVDGQWQPVRGTNSVRIRVKALIHVLPSGRVIGFGGVVA